MATIGVTYSTSREVYTYNFCEYILTYSKFSASNLSAMSTYADDALTVIVEPSSGILRAAWARPLLTGALIDSYYRLLDTAEAHGCCRFWHLDLRMGVWPAATFMHWLSETFAPLATQRLGGPLFVAGWVGQGGHRAHVEHPHTVAMQRRAAEAGLHSYFFDYEPQARAWLLHQQARSPAGRQAA